MWSSEVKTLDEISDLSHPNLIQRIASITRGRQRCLVFLWADGGNLRDFWKHNPNPWPTITATYIKDIIEQIRGLADALDKLHRFKQHEDQVDHYRHGDIKPENILIFPDEDNRGIGTFKVSDLGSAMRHSVVTALRERTKNKVFATVVYQPPESRTRKLSSTSRLYDIWSMGCVTLEFLIWLLYGYEQLQAFNEGLYGFFELQNEGRTARIHPRVQAWQNDLSGHPACQGTALGALLNIVKTKLLVIELPPDTELPVTITITDADTGSEAQKASTIHRADARHFVEALDEILDREDKSYWSTSLPLGDGTFGSDIPGIVGRDDISQSSQLAHRLKAASLQSEVSPVGGLQIPDQKVSIQSQASPIR